MRSEHASALPPLRCLAPLFIYCRSMVSNVPQDIPFRKLHFSLACQYLTTDPSASLCHLVLRRGLPELNTGGMSFKIRRPAGFFQQYLLKWKLYGFQCSCNNFYWTVADVEILRTQRRRQTEFDVALFQMRPSKAVIMLYYLVSSGHTHGLHRCECVRCSSPVKGHSVCLQAETPRTSPVM